MPPAAGLKPVYAYVSYIIRQFIIGLSDAEFFIPLISFIVWVFGMFWRL